MWVLCLFAFLALVTAPRSTPPLSSPTFFRSLDGIARSYNWIDLALVPPYIGRPLVLIAVMGLAHLAGLPADATTAMLAAVIATWLNAIIQLVMLDRRLRTKSSRAHTTPVSDQ